MKYYLKPEAFSWNGTMSVLDFSGRIRYYVTGDGFRFGKRIHVRDLAGREAIYIRQVVPSLVPQYEIEIYGRPIGTLIHQIEGCIIDGLDWFLSKTEAGWSIMAGDETLATCTVSQKAGMLLLDCGLTDLKGLGILLLVSCVLARHK